MAESGTISTPITKMFGIKHPILLAGMNVAAGPDLAAAVTNAGGLGVIGGVGYTPEFLKEQIARLKEQLKDKNAPFGVDLLLPQVGGNARATNTDYTGGKLGELIDIIIAEKVKLFVAAVGVPPKAVVEKLHKHGIYVMNMVGAPKHVSKALEVGVDIICAQGGEGGGHTGDVPSTVLIPTVVDLCRGKKSPLSGQPVQVIAAGGIYDGRGLAAALAWGASAVWVGTRFVCATEAGAPPRHQKAIVAADYDSTVRTLIYTGRPMRVIKNDYILDWQDNRGAEMRKLLKEGTIPYKADAAANPNPSPDQLKEMMKNMPLLMGSCAGAIKDILPAKQIIDEMVSGAIEQLELATSHVRRSKL